ncbi:MAG: DUF4301 family protein [Bacteroidales bacterium]|nr:DUF4301 family protein [Bacteroidales bacterium]
MLTHKDEEQLNAIGIAKGKVELQLENFAKGFPFLNVIKPATVGDGIIRLELSEVDDLVELFKCFEGTITKFVPASGAATRMFQNLHTLSEEFPTKGMESFSDKGTDSAWSFFENLDKFPFYEELVATLNKMGLNIKNLLEQNDYPTIIDVILNSHALNFGSKPKGLLPFHKYQDTIRTAFEEHIVEGAQYARTANNAVNIHLTISPEHKTGFEKLCDDVLDRYATLHGVKINITYSEQKKSTDTIAVDLDNQPLRNDDSKLIFRPGGHGALVENLNELNDELIFIKNIDNVAPDRLKPQTVLYKKALAGLLMSYQSLIFDYLSQLMGPEKPSHEFLLDALDFTINELCVLPPAGLNTADSKSLCEYLTEKLNRPIRVCGMVKNTGEPGGGPFWATNRDGSISLQIVETSQIDLSKPKEKAILEASTHFNPVDLVCGVINLYGEKFDLLRFRDPDTGFISTKSKDGKMLKAQELPGLWNGAMSDWNTIFVEVPSATFSPVKTVNDLLRDEHRS